MDETQISITVKPIYLERLLYWVLILILLVLLAVAWLKDDTCTDTTQTKTADTKGTVATPPKETTPPPVVDTPKTPTASCSDSIKNQDETDIDCGGSCTSKCISGKTCASNSDCASTICTNKLCTTTPPAAGLSGKLEIDLTKVDFTKSASDSVKITGVAYKVTNGLSENLDQLIVRIYVKNKANTRCLNQLEDTSACDETYAEFAVPALNSGKSFQEGRVLEKSDYTSKKGFYIFGPENGYDAQSSSDNKFNVVAYLYDKDGNEVGGKIISDLYLVSP